MTVQNRWVGFNATPLVVHVQCMYSTSYSLDCCNVHVYLYCLAVYWSTSVFSLLCRISSKSSRESWVAILRMWCWLCSWPRESMMHLSYTKQLRCIYIYCISLKSCHTLKSRRPRNLATYFSHLIPINTALEISRHGIGSPTVYVCAYTLDMYVHTIKLITEAVQAHACWSL